MSKLKKPFSCPDCGKGCITKPALYKHRSRHHREITSQRLGKIPDDAYDPHCPHCDRKFSWAGHLSRHIKNKHSQNKIPSATEVLSSTEMDRDFEEDLSSALTNCGYSRRAAEASSGQCKQFNQCLNQGKLPAEGWSEQMLEAFLSRLAAMDSNNFPHQSGAGEREGRVACPMVARRHGFMSHGVGRSGDIAASQPKAAGSSLLNQLATRLCLDAIRLAGIHSCQSTLILPTATGMSLMLCLLAWKREKPSAQYVIWSRIDQKSCFKAILAAGLQPIIVDTVASNSDGLITDVDQIRRSIEDGGVENILCVMTTTSCFAPRLPDNVELVAEICERYGVRHLINNAYGLQSSKYCHMIEQASKRGRVDAFVQSADKNFLVPVGGAIIAGFESGQIQNIARTYPGRGSSTPSFDLLTTLLWQGRRGWMKMLDERKTNFDYLKSSLDKLCDDFNNSERVLHTPANTISLAVTLASLDRKGVNPSTISQIGSRLFSRSITGARVIVLNEHKTIEDHHFDCWGGHSSQIRQSYLNVACAIGMQTGEIDVLLRALRKTFNETFRG